MAGRHYHTLLILDPERGTWGPDFGDYDLEVVKDEREEYRDNGFKTKIITTTEEQGDIDATVDRLNGGPDWRLGLVS